MYASPLRDGGYDIADFYSIHPDYGSVEDFRTFVDARPPTRHPRDRRSGDEPHLDRPPLVPGGALGSELARSATGTCGRTRPIAIPDARVIFVDSEASNWTWDPVAGQYYWHRFFSHQPDLNFDNPDVHDAMIDVLRFWLDFGLDGFRLDAVPYLFERDGTNCENLPETHALPQAGARRDRRELSRPRAARRGQPVAGRRRRLLRRAATSATWRSTSR